MARGRLRKRRLRPRPLVWQLIDSSSVGGAERHIELLASGLMRNGFDVEVVLLAEHGNNVWGRQLAAAGIRKRTLDGTLAGLFAALHQHAPDLLHTHGYKAGIMGRLLATLTGIPRACTFHSGGRGRFPLWAYQWLDEWTSIASARIAVSDAIADRLPFGADVIPNWTVIRDAPPQEPLPLRVVFVGRMSPEKGPDLFCELAMRSPPEIMWCAYGDGPMRADLEQRYGERVRFHGIVADLEPVWREAGLLCMPSWEEGLPLAALEALAVGVPVLASAVGALPDVVEHDKTGWLFPPGDLARASSLLQTWQRTAGTPGSLRRDCWNSVRTRFSEQELLPRVLAVYRSAGLALPRAAA